MDLFQLSKFAHQLLLNNSDAEHNITTTGPKLQSAKDFSEMWNEEEIEMSAMCQAPISGPDGKQDESVLKPRFIHNCDDDIQTESYSAVKFGQLKYQPRLEFDELSLNAFADLRSGNPAIVVQILAEYSAVSKASNMLFSWIVPRLPADHGFTINLIKALGFSPAATQFYAIESVRAIGLSVFAWLEEHNFFREALKILTALTSAGLSLETTNLQLFLVHATFTPASHVLAIANVYLRGGMLREALAVMNRQVLSPSLREWHKDCSFGLPEDMEKRDLIVKELIQASTTTELDTGLTVFKTIFLAQNNMKNPTDLHPLVESLLFGSIEADCAVTALELAVCVPWSMLLHQCPVVVRALVTLIHEAAPQMATEMFREGIRLFAYPKPGKLHRGVLITAISSSWTTEEVKIALAISLMDCIEHLHDNLSVVVIRIERADACGGTQPPCLARVNTSVSAAKKRLGAALSTLVPPIGVQQSSAGEVLLAPVGVARHMAALRRRTAVFGPGNRFDDEPLPAKDPRAPHPIPAKRPMIMKVILNWDPLPNRGPLVLEAPAAEDPLPLRIPCR